MFIVTYELLRFGHQLHFSDFYLLKPKKSFKQKIEHLPVMIRFTGPLEGIRFKSFHSL